MTMKKDKSRDRHDVFGGVIYEDHMSFLAPDSES